MFKLLFVAIFGLLAILTLSGVQSQLYDDDLLQEFLNWDPPAELKKKYPYFLSGVDKEGSPVWVIEFGRWDIRSTMAQGGQIVEDFEKYTEQMVQRWHHSPRNFSREENIIQKYVLIADLGKYSLSQLTHLPSVRKYLDIVGQFVETQREFQSLKKEYIINTNIFFNTLWTTSQPVLSPLMEYIELFNETQSIWKSALLDKIDADQLPIWLGGSLQKKWKPIKVFG